MASTTDKGAARNGLIGMRFAYFDKRPGPSAIMYIDVVGNAKTRKIVWSDWLLPATATDGTGNAHYHSRRVSTWLKNQ